MKAQQGTPTVSVVNFSHPLNATQLAQIEVLTGLAIERVLDVPAIVEHQSSFAIQAAELVNAVPLRARDWQTAAIIVNLPGFAPLAGVILAEIHGRMGHFPTIVRLRPESRGAVTTYAVAEVLDLQRVRDAARMRR